MHTNQGSASILAILSDDWNASQPRLNVIGPGGSLSSDFQFPPKRWRRRQAGRRLINLLVRGTRFSQPLMNSAYALPDPFASSYFTARP